MLGDNDLGYILLDRIFFILVRAIDEHDDIGILLKRAGFAQVGEHRALVRALLDRA